MKKSKFIIVTELKSDSNILLCYHTRTTALISLDKPTYIRMLENFDLTIGEAEVLKKMGFIVDDDYDELDLIVKKRAEFLESPEQQLTIITTTDCNARCPYCFEAGIKHYYMTEKTADDIVSFCLKMFPSKELWISWFGGEPLLNFGIITYLTEKLLACGYEINGHITTNGSLLTQGIVDYCVEKYKKFSCQVTIDDIHEKYWEIKRYIDIKKEEAFNIVIHNVIMLLKNNIETSVRINFKTSRFANAQVVFETLNALLSQYNKNGKLYIYFAPLAIKDKNEIISDFHCEGVHPYLQMVNIQNNAGYLIDEHRFNSSINKMAAYGLMPTCGSCGMTNKNKFAIDADGSIYKCHRLVGRKEFCCGDIVNGIDQDSECYKFYRDSNIRDPQCKNCNILPICQEGCKARRLLLGEQYKCSNITQVKDVLVNIFYEELKKEVK